VNKLFFLGGDDTIRGFEQDAVDDSGGTVAILYNAELHFRLFEAFKLAGFFDAGVLTNNFGDITWEGWRESAGVGIRYFTPVGPVRLDLGFILDRRNNEPKQRLHFSFGYFF
jgi:outer membrane protein insertion porin family